MGGCADGILVRFWCYSFLIHIFCGNKGNQIGSCKWKFVLETIVFLTVCLTNPFARGLYQGKNMYGPSFQLESM